jgi:CRISPR-associated protein Cas5t
MQLLKIEGYQLFANYKKPLSYGYWETYPFPPLSTLKGWFHNVINAKKYVDLSIGLCFDYSFIINDFQKIIKFDRNRGNANDNLLTSVNKAVISSMVYVANVFDINLTIYFYAEKQYLDIFKNNIFNNYRHIGRGEDLIRIDSIDFIEPAEQTFTNLKPHEIDYGIILKKETAEKLNIQGLNYHLPFKYDNDKLQKTNIRYFNYVDIVYPDPDSISLIDINSMLLDTNNNKIIEMIGDYSWNSTRKNMEIITKQ